MPLMEEGWESLPIGRGEVLREGDDLLIVAYGAMVHPALATATLLEEAGLSTTVVNGRFLRPLDEELLHPLARKIKRVVTMEEGALDGGFGAAVLESLSDNDIPVSMLRIGIPDQLVDHAPSPEQGCPGSDPGADGGSDPEPFPAGWLRLHRRRIGGSIGSGLSSDSLP